MVDESNGVSFLQFLPFICAKKVLFFNIILDHIANLTLFPRKRKTVLIFSMFYWKNTSCMVR